MGVPRPLRPRKYAASMPPAITNKPSGTPAPMPTFAPVDRPPVPCWLESVVVVKGEAVELALPVAVAVASAEIGVVTLPPLAIANDLELIPSHIRSNKLG